MKRDSVSEPPVVRPLERDFISFTPRASEGPVLTPGSIETPTGHLLGKKSVMSSAVRPDFRTAPRAPRTHPLRSQLRPERSLGRRFTFPGKRLRDQEWHDERRLGSDLWGEARAPW